MSSQEQQDGKTNKPTFDPLMNDNGLFKDHVPKARPAHQDTPVDLSHFLEEAEQDVPHTPPSPTPNTNIFAAKSSASKAKASLFGEDDEDEEEGYVGKAGNILDRVHDGANYKPKASVFDLIRAADEHMGGVAAQKAADNAAKLEQDAQASSDQDATMKKAKMKFEEENEEEEKKKETKKDFEGIYIPHGGANMNDVTPASVNDEGLSDLLSGEEEDLSALAKKKQQQPQQQQQQTIQPDEDDGLDDLFAIAGDTPKEPNAIGDDFDFAAYLKNNSNNDDDVGGLFG